MLAERSARAARQRIGEERRRLGSLGQMLASLSYQSVLKRGFALVRDEDGRAVRAAAAVTLDQRLSVELADGRFGARVTEAPGGDVAGASRAAAPPPGPRPLRPGKPSRTGSGGQGSLF